MPRAAQQRRLPLSGSEPVCTKAPYGLPKTIIRNNCFAYAVQHLAKSGTPYKLQPGNLSGLKGIDFNLTSCHPALKRTLQDLVRTGKGYQESMDKSCKEGYAKIALMLSKGNDFHFIRQNGSVVYPAEANETRKSIAAKFKVPISKVLVKKKTPLKAGDVVRIVDAGVWSHKRGTYYPPSLYDAKQKLIFDPRKANFDYGSLHYNKFCSSFCVKQKPCNRKKKM